MINIIFTKIYLEQVDMMIKKGHLRWMWHHGAISGRRGLRLLVNAIFHHCVGGLFKSISFQGSMSVVN